jgi:hypothetical protein
VPAAIRRKAKKVGPTRFFGTFEQGGRAFAIHFYDDSRVRSSRNSAYGGQLERSSHLDVFLFTASKTWQRIQSCAVVRLVEDRRDKIRVEAKSLWLDPKRKTTPMIYLTVMDNYEPFGFGNRTDVYGALLDRPNSKAFITFNGYVPYNPSTITSSEMSHPDSKGQLTILSVESDPSYTSYTAYGWTGEKWKNLASTKFENNPDKGLRWNGIQFVPAANEG